jgi:hypothetical protein
VAQFGRPTTDEALGTWDDPTFSVIDETSRSDSDLSTTSNNPSADIVRVGGFGLLAPDAGTRTLRIAVGKGQDGARTINITVRLIADAATKHTWTYNGVAAIGSESTKVETITATIDDYSTVAVEVEGNTTGGGSPSTAACSWLEIEIPDAAPVTIDLDATGMGVSSGSARLGGDRALKATGTGVSAANALLGAKRAIAAVGASVSAATAGPLIRRRAIAATGTGIGAGTGTATRRRAVSAVGVGFGVATALLTISGAGATIALSATGVGVSAGTAVIVPPVRLYDSANVAPSGENTTPQLTTPPGKTTGEFGGGRLTDDENPADSVDLAADEYGEWEFAIEFSDPAPDAIYEFRIVTGDGTPIGSYIELGEAQTIAAVPLQAKGVGVSAGTAQLTRTRDLSATGTGLGAGSSLLGAKRALAAVGVGISAGTAATFELVTTLAATGVGVSAGTAVLGGTRALSATGVGVSAGTALPSIPGVTPLQAVGAGVSAGSARLDRTLGARATGTGVSAATAQPSRTRQITATGVGVSAGTAWLVRQLAISATGTGVSAGSCAVQRRLAIAATGVGVSAGTARVEPIAECVIMVDFVLNNPGFTAVTHTSPGFLLTSIATPELLAVSLVMPQLTSMAAAMPELVLVDRKEC